MKRDIKFRAKRKLNGDWVYGSLIRGDSEDWDFIHEIPHNEEYNPIRVITNTIGQFTELLDKNGKEIYEGDIVLCHDHPTGVDDIKGEVYFEQGAYKVKGAMPYLHDYGTAWTLVVGNIYENRELLDQP